MPNEGDTGVPKHSANPVTAHLAATFAGFPVYVWTIAHADGVVLVVGDDPADARGGRRARGHRRQAGPAGRVLRATDALSGPVVGQGHTVHGPGETITTSNAFASLAYEGVALSAVDLT